MTRRAALTSAGVAALALAGCSSPPPRARPTGVTVSADPLGPLYTETVALITMYDRSIATNPGIDSLTRPLREEHRQHAIALAALMGIAAPSVTAGPDAGGRPMPPTTAPPVPAPPILGDSETTAARTLLANAEKIALANATAACLSAPSARADVLASIAACRATHVAVLA